MELDPDMQSLMDGTMTTQKGVARVATNIKSMSGVPTGAIATLPAGGWVYGNYSPTRTDLLDVIEYYRPSGERIALAVPCKVSVSNLTVTSFTDPVVPPFDPPIPPVTPIDVNVNIDNFGIITVTVNGEVYLKAE